MSGQRTEDALDLPPEALAEIERRRAEIDAGEIGGVVLDAEDEEAHFAACEEIDELDRRGELIPVEEFLAKRRARRAERLAG